MQYFGTILGSDGVDAYWDGENYGDRFTKNLTNAEEDKMSIGVGWLTSLEIGKTKEAEQITIKWTEEWLGNKEDKKVIEKVTTQTCHAVESAIDAAKDPKGTWEQKAKKIKVSHWREKK